MSSARELAGMRVLVTGASRGIGRAIARVLLGSGARLAVVGRNRAELDSVLEGAGAGHTALVADLLSGEQAESLTERAVQALGGLDAFVSSAGIVEYVHSGALTAESIERQLAVNFVSPMRIALSAARVLPRGGNMVFVASTLAVAPAALTLGYGSSKAALVAAVRSLALELAPRGIRVNAVAPGPVDTEMLRVVRYQPGEPPMARQAEELRIAQQLESLAQAHPLKRLAQPDDVAYTVSYLLLAPYVTGNVVAVDGGLLLGAGAP